MKDLIAEEINSHINVMLKIVEDEKLLNEIDIVASSINKAIRTQQKVISFGNGGSCSDAQHFATELSGKYRNERPAYAAMALSDSGAMSCIANDFGYSQVFKRQLEALGRPMDVVLALSTSGNSENVLTAAEYAKRCGMIIIGITGQQSKLKDLCDICIEIPHHGFADRIQEATIVILHIIVMLVEKKDGIN
jgi:D-sedoheptulose 7-phosphate isomerase